MALDMLCSGTITSKSKFRKVSMMHWKFAITRRTNLCMKGTAEPHSMMLKRRPKIQQWYSEYRLEILQ
jgi:hypothetical protein